MIILQNSFLKIQMYDKLVTMLLFYHFSVKKMTFSTFNDVSLSV